MRQRLVKLFKSKQTTETKNALGIGRMCEALAIIVGASNGQANFCTDSNQHKKAMQPNQKVAIDFFDSKITLHLWEFQLVARAVPLLAQH